MKAHRTAESDLSGGKPAVTVTRSRAVTCITSFGPLSWHADLRHSPQLDRRSWQMTVRELTLPHFPNLLLQ
jgi:hypothetical protein